jgi:hypothetical protein
VVAENDEVIGCGSGVMVVDDDSGDDMIDDSGNVDDDTVDNDTADESYSGYT